MKQKDLPALYEYLKMLADENRLRMLGYIASQERNVSELAALLDLTEPTVSHHLAKLREAGYVNLRQAGNQRFYRLNPGTLRRVSQQVAELAQVDMTPDEPEADQSWIDALDLDAYDRAVLRDYTLNGQLKDIPVKQKKLLAVLRWLATEFQPDRTYTEREVNAILTQYHEDYARLRRELIDFGFLRRERGGGKYWVTPEEEKV